MDADDYFKAEEVDAEEVGSNSNSILDPPTEDFEIELQDLDSETKSDDPVSDEDPFELDKSEDEPGGIGSLLGIDMK